MKSEKIDPSANEFKDQGNKFFASRKYQEAISSYSKAIVSNILEYRSSDKDKINVKL